MSDITVTSWTCWRNPEHDRVNTTMFGWPQCAICRAAPEFHERPNYLPENFVLGIYVPVDGDALRRRAIAMIAPRSAVVGLHDGGDGDDARIQVYYEGWTNGPMQYADRDARGLWEAGVYHAASRMVTGYPTIAQAYLPADQLAYVGLYYPKTKRIIVDADQRLAEWLA